MTAETAVAGFEAGDLHPIITAGDIPGNGNNVDVDIRELRLGLGHYFRTSLGFYSELSLYKPTGERDGRSVSTTALGLEFAVRWHFISRTHFSLYADWGIGVMWGLDPFPPAGTKANATPHFGLGAAVPLKKDLQLLAGLRQLHMSNGRGAVDDNPSFDGLGAYVGLVLKPRFKAPFPAIGEPILFGKNGLRLRIDATYERIDEEDSPGGTIALDFPLLRGSGLYGQVAGSIAELVDETTWNAAFSLYRERSLYRLALGYAHMEFNVFKSEFFRLQYERVLNDISTLKTMTAFEKRNLSDDRIFGGLFITVYPVDALALRSGIGFERQEDEFLNSLENLNDAGFNFGVEWSPDLLATVGLSLFVQGGIGYDDEIAGLRFQSGGKRSLRSRHHQGSLEFLR